MCLHNARYLSGASNLRTTATTTLSARPATEARRPSTGGAPVPAYGGEVRWPRPAAQGDPGHLVVAGRGQDRGGGQPRRGVGPGWLSCAESALAKVRIAPASPTCWWATPPSPMSFAATSRLPHPAPHRGQNSPDFGDIQTVCATVGSVLDARLRPAGAKARGATSPWGAPRACKRTDAVREELEPDHTHARPSRCPSYLVNDTAGIHENIRRERRSRGVACLLLFVFVVLITQDAFRKYFGVSSWVLLLQDLGVLLLYMVGTRVGRGLASIPKGALLASSALAMWVALEATTPASSVATALLGIHTYLWYLPLIVVGSIHLSTERASRQIYTVLGLAGATVGVLAVVSAVLGDSGPAVLRPIAESTARRSYGDSAGIYLPPSVFATAEKAANFLVLCLAGSQLSTLSSRFPRSFHRLMVLCMIAGLLATQRRTAIILGLGMVGAILLAARSGGSSTRTRNRWIWRPLAIAIMVGLGAAAPAGVVVSARAFGSFLSDPSNAANVAQTAVILPPDPLALEGQGSGTSTLGLDKVGGDIPSLARAEGVLTKVWLELGLVGFLLFSALICTIMLPLIRALSGVNRDATTWTCYAIAVLLLSLKGHQVMDNPQVQIPFWLAVGAAYGHIARRQTTSATGAPQLGRRRPNWPLQPMGGIVPHSRTPHR